LDLIFPRDFPVVNWEILLVYLVGGIFIIPVVVVISDGITRQIVFCDAWNAQGLDIRLIECRRQLNAVGDTLRRSLRNSLRGNANWLTKVVLVKLTWLRIALYELARLRIALDELARLLGRLLDRLLDELARLLGRLLDELARLLGRLLNLRRSLNELARLLTLRH